MGIKSIKHTLKNVKGQNGNCRAQRCDKLTGVTESTDAPFSSKISTKSFLQAIVAAANGDRPVYKNQTTRN